MSAISYLKRHQLILLIAVNVVAAFAAWNVWSSRDNAVELDERLPYDAQIAPHVLDQLALFRAPGTTSALVFLPSDTPQVAGANYLRVLAERYQTQGLGLVVVKPANSAEVDASGIVKDDAKETIHHAFQTGGSHRHATVALITSSGKVKFHSLALPQDDVMRQVVERHVAGRIDYDGVEDALVDLFTEAAPAPTMTLTNVMDGDTFRFDSESAKNKTVVLISAPCAPCQLSIVSRTIASVAQASERDGDVIVIAAPHFDAALIKSAFAQVPSAQIFTAHSIPGYDRYATRGKQTDLRPTVVRVDANGKLTSKEKLQVS